MATTLVTGVTGTLGVPTVARLREAGHDVRALSRRTRPGPAGGRAVRPEGLRRAPRRTVDRAGLSADGPFAPPRAGYRGATHIGSEARHDRGQHDRPPLRRRRRQLRAGRRPPG